MEDELTARQGTGTSGDHPLSIPDLLAAGVQHHNAGRLSEAQAAYMQVLKAASTHPIALHLMGVVALQVGQNQSAVDLITQALVVKPDYADAHSNLGNALKALGRLDEAVASYEKAIACNPKFVSAHYNLGNGLHELGRLEDAVASYRQALTIKPDYADASTNLGNVYNELGQLDEAVAAYRKALSIKPDFAEGHYNLGSALAALGHEDDAVASYQKAIAIRPNYAEAHSNLGSLYRDMWDMDEAIECFRKALEIEPELASAHSNLGTVLKNVWRLGEAIDCYRKALAIDPEYTEAYSNMGNALKELSDLSGAFECYRKALDLEPDSLAPRRNLGLALLSTGDFENGWAYFSSRWEADDLPRCPTFFDKPLWRGESLKEPADTTAFKPKKILLWMEMGIGDEIMFASMIPDLVATGGKVVVECEVRLIALFERSFPGVQFVARGAPMDDGWPGEGMDYQIPAGNLGRYLRQSIDQFPKSPHFLLPDDAKRTSFRSNYTNRWPGKRLVGISWRSGDRTAGVKRSISLDQWSPILSNPDCQFINLQYGDVAADLTSLKDATGHEVYCDPNVDPVVDMDTFAAQVAALDLVISIDNSTVHVSGSLGVPTWVMLPAVAEWRWLTGRDDSIWYDSLHLYRQPERDDWESVISHVAKELQNNHG